MSRINLIVDNTLTDEPPHYLTVNASDRIEIIIDEFGVRARSDGEKFDKISVDENEKDIVFDNQLTLFDSTPWKL
jgi:hypothetical protein